MIGTRTPTNVPHWQELAIVQQLLERISALEAELALLGARAPDRAR